MTKRNSYHGIRTVPEYEVRKDIAELESKGFMILKLTPFHHKGVTAVCIEYDAVDDRVELAKEYASAVKDLMKANGLPPDLMTEILKMANRH